MSMSQGKNWPSSTLIILPDVIHQEGNSLNLSNLNKTWLYSNYLTI